ncbi:pentapeptide repeat-containing protein [Polynucleobacter asymbioticus]|uniref:Pentapeptide repeat-containing protein n=1 Tax=Polynucleobacter asymbioticus TaxID=576611 RepID=A0AAC9IVD5_9BURK|nr:pentapeptide repeat-containing protein [Polynucleobacter asymbioticus]APC01353.1 hypothetical protein AOC25_06865 [Polynucleobacter asymbioticus]
MNIKIVSRWDSAQILFEGNVDSLKSLLEKAKKEGADLRGAYLECADLRGAYLECADLRGADLRGADLECADLRGADLEGADLRGADLRGADLRGAYLEGADLRGADLRGADLRGADLRGAKIDGEEITKTPLMIMGLTYWVLITEGYMRIGCKRYTHQEWAEFKDPTIATMDSKALNFWGEWKDTLLTICKKHSAEVL